MHVGLGRKLKEVKAILAEENANVSIDCSSPHGQELPEENFLEGFLLAGLGVRKCHGCKGGNVKNKMPAFKRFHILYAGAVNIQGPKTKEWCQHYGNIYFHLTMSCVKSTTRK